ncbi:FAD-dependent oxidoreductase [uncultured Jatrophihabitans sp.]|uniref:FAD-dependent oxidoreductase n=1 Tax=uncultured Jatrophihabitans sp. TaxID=1610747 RepID=UPI0035CC0A47
MAAEDPVVIVGAGLMGSAAAWALTRRGVPVVVLEQFALGHRHGSSHGSARIVRRAYGDPLYVSLTGRAFELWRELEAAFGAPVLRMLGGLDFGAGRRVPAVAALLADAGVPHEVLPAAEAESRWPGMLFSGDVVFHAQAGTVDAGAAVAAFLRLAESAGATVRDSTSVAAARPGGVVLADGSTLTARAVVLAAGGWLPRLVAGGAVADGLGDGLALPPLTVTEQSVFHFPRRDPAAPPWPSVIHEDGRAAFYHLAGGRDGGAGDDRKVGLHDAGPAVEAAARAVAADGARSAAVNEAARAAVVDYVREWLPGLVPEPRGEATCLYVTTPSEEFLLDRVNGLVLCSPCSGHGAKFAPLIGEYVADLVTGADTAGMPGRFRLAAHRAGRAAHVSL